MTQHLDLDALQSEIAALRNSERSRMDINCDVLAALIDRLRKAEAARNGYQLVPIEPTPVMISEAWRALIGNADYAKIRNAWGQMLAAAPDSTPTDSTGVNHG